MSGDTQEELANWKKELNLPYDLLSDVDHVMLAEWSVSVERERDGERYKSVNRSYWVIDENGTVIAGQVGTTPTDSVKEALEAIGQ